MALLDPESDGRFALGTRLELRIAGAESNYAVALRRLGVDVAWVSRLGDDPLGDLVVSALEAEGVDLRWVRRSPERPTGLYLKFREGGRTTVLYYRRGSAASELAPEDVPEEALEGIDLLHLSGITTGIAPRGTELLAGLAERARGAGALVVFDPNWRPPLWERFEEAERAARPIYPHVDWYLCGLEEGNGLFGTDGEEALFAALERAGMPRAAVRVGARGALVRGAGGGLVEVPPIRLVEVRDEVGAGDGFAAGFAFGLLRGWEPERCARAGNAVAAAALAGTGDWETYPRLEEVREDLGITDEATA
jgi:sugar/nucleoside kinase (ribokinase family)